MHGVDAPEAHENVIFKRQTVQKLVLIAGGNHEPAEDEKEIDKQVGVFNQGKACEMALDLTVEVKKHDHACAEAAP